MSGDNYFIRDQNATYFLTFTVEDWIDVFTRKEYRIVIADSLNYCIDKKGLEVFAWCLMSNHIHLVSRAKENYRISEIIRDFKKHTAKTILKKIETEPESRKEWMLHRFRYAGKFDNRISNYKFWQETNHAVLLHNSGLIEQRINYLHENPVRALIVSNAEEYLYSSARDYAGEKGIVLIQQELRVKNSKTSSPSLPLSLKRGEGSIFVEDYQLGYNFIWGIIRQKRDSTTLNEVWFYKDFYVKNK